jgi:hypothetical protein
MGQSDGDIEPQDHLASDSDAQSMPEGYVADGDVADFGFAVHEESQMSDTGAPFDGQPAGISEPGAESTAVPSTEATSARSGSSILAPADGGLSTWIAGHPAVLAYAVLRAQV